MEFVGNLCLALGCTLGTVCAMSAAEFRFWRAFHRRHGFPVDRLEAAVAIGAAAQCRAWGASVDPQDLIPRFDRSRSMAELAARLAALPGAKVTYIPNPEAAINGG